MAKGGTHELHELTLIEPEKIFLNKICRSEEMSGMHHQRKMNGKNRSHIFFAFHE